MPLESYDDEFAEVERYELREPRSHFFGASRREFLHTLGAGLVVTVSADLSSAQQPRGRNSQRTARRDERLSDRFHFGGDGVVTVLTSKVEAGQGSRTQIAQAAAEELRIPLEQVRVLMADTELCPDDGGTAGSRTTPSTVPRIQTAAAAAREAIAQLAAQRLGIERSQIRIEKGIFSNGESKQIGLAELVQDSGFAARLSEIIPDGVSVARVDQWTTLGKPAAKLNGREVVTGAAVYPSDVVRPEMLYGSVLRPASYNAKLTSIDLAPAKAMDGVTVVRDGDFVGCAAATSWQARKAVEVLAATAQWERSSHPSSKEVFEHFKRTAGSGGGGGRGGDRWGNYEAALASSDKRLDVSYTAAYIQHAPMEPRAAVAEWNADKLTVWTGTQQPGRVQSDLAQAFGLPPNRVRVIVPDTGGGFGGKHSGEAAIEAARLAKAAGRPVSLRWTREEEFTWAYFRPAGLIEVRAGLDSSGKLHAWDFTNFNSGGSAIGTPYRAAAGRTRFVSADSPLRQGSYRALASTANTFARESAMDELAKLAEADPLEFRLRHLDEGRLKDVLRAAAEKFDWPRRRSRVAKGRGVGLACGTEKGSFVAACVEVEVSDEKIKALSVCEAFECGAIQNPPNLRAQVEGAVVMGLGGALWEEMQFQDGKVANASFSQYRVPRMDDLPELDIVLLDRRDLASVGAGETPIIAIAPAIANAVSQATGVRCRSMPLRV